MPQSSQSIRGLAGELADRQRTGRHRHDDEHQLVYARSGVLTVVADEGTWVVPPQRALWMPARHPHELIASGPTSIRTIYLPAAINPLGLTTPTVLAVSPLQREVMVALAEGDPTENERRHLEAVLVDCLQRADVAPLHLPDPTDGRLRAITDALRTDPSDRRPLAAWATEVGAGERTLARLFRQELGISFATWRTQARLHRALVLLAEGAPVTQVALACGYRNPSSFITTFRLAFTQTPSHFRPTR
jgi:AraC-like DNA-binding protein